jgi:hypothetical protein
MMIARQSMKFNPAIHKHVQERRKSLRRNWTVASVRNIHKRQKINVHCGTNVIDHTFVALGMLLPILVRAAPA